MAMTATDRPELLSAAEVAELFQIRPKAVTRYAEKLPYVRTLGGQRRYLAAEVRRIRDYMFEHGTTVEETKAILGIRVPADEQLSQTA